MKVNLIRQSALGGSHDGHAFSLTLPMERGFGSKDLQLMVHAARVWVSEARSPDYKITFGDRAFGLGLESRGSETMPYVRMSGNVTMRGPELYNSERTIEILTPLLVRLAQTDGVDSFSHATLDVPGFAYKFTLNKRGLVPA